MSIFAVIREAGPGWRDGGIYEQPEVAEHATFMNALADSGFVLLAGPLAGTEHGRVRVLLIVDAKTRTRSTADSPTIPGSRPNSSSPERSSRGRSSSAQNDSRLHMRWLR